MCHDLSTGFPMATLVRDTFYRKLNASWRTDTSCPRTLDKHLYCSQWTCYQSIRAPDKHSRERAPEGSTQARPTVLTTGSDSPHAASQCNIGVCLLPASFCSFLSMLDTQDAQVMPVICKKHFCGVIVAEAFGDFVDWRGLWGLGCPPVWRAASSIDMGVPAAVCTGIFMAL